MYIVPLIKHATYAEAEAASDTGSFAILDGDTTDFS